LKAKARLLISVLVVLGLVGTILLWRGSRSGVPRPPEHSARPEHSAGPDSSTSPDLVLESFLEDVTARAGIDFVHEAGARGERLNPETFGPGGGWLDYDQDGNIDVLLVNGNVIRGPLDPTKTHALYKNLGDGTFRNVTVEAGLDVPFYGMGFLAGDVDNDGDPDLLLYGLHRCVFFLNRGKGLFKESTRTAGLDGLKGWVCVAAFVDYDRDARLDLIIGNYVKWSPQIDAEADCNFGGPEKQYCPVSAFGATHPQLFRGLGDGRFEETTEAAGFSKLKGKALGIVAEDYDRDGAPDIFVANDAVPNFLLRNLSNGTFEDRGLISGFSTDTQGAALAGMGIDSTWAPNDGSLRIAIGNFSGEPTTLHVQEDGEFFQEESFSNGLAEETLSKVTFGAILYDHNLDGVVDLATANGHVFDVEDLTRVPYRQPLQLFLGRDGKSFSPIRPKAPDDVLGQKFLGRALAYADYDGDGDLDLLLTDNQGAARLLRNNLPDPKRYVRFHLEGTKSTRDAIGAEVTLRTRRGGGSTGWNWSQRRTRKSVSSYLSQNEPALTFGLREDEVLVEAAVLWPLGLREVFKDVSPGTQTLLVEGQGVPENAPATRQTSTSGSPSMENSIVQRHRGMEFFQRRQYANATSAFESAVQLDPHDFAAHRFLLICAEILKKPALVESRIRTIRETFPSSDLLVTHFGLVLREQRHFALAERLYLEAAKLDPTRADIWNNLGLVNFYQQDYNGALTSYEKALEVKPDSVTAFTNIGKIYTIQGDYARAAETLEKAISLRPGYAPALASLGGALFEQGKIADAEDRLHEALRHCRAADKGTRISIHWSLGHLYLRSQNLPRAMAEFENVVALDPKHQDAQALLEQLGRL